MSEGCPPPARLLLALLEPQPPETRAELTGHLAACDRCRDLFQAMRSLGYTAPSETTAARTPECPSPERLDALVEPRESRDDDEAVAAHALACPHCQHALEAAMHRARARRQDEPAPRDVTEPAPIGRPARRLLGLLLLVLGVLALVVWQLA